MGGVRPNVWGMEGGGEWGMGGMHKDVWIYYVELSLFEEGMQILIGGVSDWCKCSRGPWGGVPGTRFPGYLRAKFPFPGNKKKSGIC